MGRLYDLIKDGGLNVVGGAGRAAMAVRAKPALASELVDLLSDSNPAVRMRAADALEKASVQNEALLAPHKDALLEKAEATAQKELRWHFAQLLPRLPLDAEERFDLAELLQRWYARDNSRIVRTFALQGLVDLAGQDGRFIGPAQVLVLDAQDSPLPAVRARARKLAPVLARLKANQED